MVCTPRRRTTIIPSEGRTQVGSDRRLSVSYPHTPPATPASPKSASGLGTASVRDRTYNEAYERIKAKATWIQTPPNSNSSSTATVRHFPSHTSPLVRADTPRPMASDEAQLSDLTPWIVMELEATVASIPRVNLQIDSPVILQICLPVDHHSVPKKTQPILPLSRYSNFNGPLSSHPTHTPSSFPLPSSLVFHAPSNSTNPLHSIFPRASSHLLSSLRATYLALHYVSTVHLASPSTRPFSHTETPSPLSSDIPYIPAKARAMLGLQIPTTRPGLPAAWMRPETRGWRERIESLEHKLRREVARLIRMCEGSDFGKNEALIRAVGQIVKLGQENTIDGIDESWSDR